MPGPEDTLIVHTPDDVERALHEGIALQNAGALDDAMAHYARVAASPDPACSSAGWRHVAGIYRVRAAWDDALDAARRAVALAEAAGVRELLAEAINAEAIIHQLRGDLDAAAPLLEQMLAITADAKGQGLALQNLGSIAAQRGDFNTAKRHFLRSHQCFERAGYTHGVAFVLNNFARAALDHGNSLLASPMLADALGAAQRVGDRDLEALVRRNFAEAQLGLNQLDAARVQLDAAEAICYATGNRALLVECGWLRGALAEREDDRPAALRAYAAAHALAVALGTEPERIRLEARLRALDVASGGVPG